MFATGTARCPVRIPNVLREGGPFYLQPLVRLQSDIWFSMTRMGENTIGDLMKEMKNNSPLCLICPNKKLRNRSARETLVKKLQKNGVQSMKIISIAGHSTTKGLQSYDEGDETQQHILSNIIDGPSSLQPCNCLPGSNAATVSHVRPFTPSTLSSVPSTVASKSAVVAVSSSRRPGTVQSRPYCGALQVSPTQCKTQLHSRMPLRSVDMNWSAVMFHPRAAPIPAQVMPMAMPAQQICNIQNCNVTIASTSEQSQRQPHAPTSALSAFLPS